VTPSFCKVSVPLFNAVCLHEFACVSLFVLGGMLYWFAWFVGLLVWPYIVQLGPY
jgi:hypothetical protein